MIPPVLIGALLQQGATDLEAVSNNCGVDDAGLGSLLAAHRLRRVATFIPEGWQSRGDTDLDLLRWDERYTTQYSHSPEMLLDLARQAGDWKRTDDQVLLDAMAAYGAELAKDAAAHRKPVKRW
ncbi:hypothetical protein NRB56_28700 [Nocardia sp. RB56]|uniref:Uncharacterized protein n=1 Tax=Nocardia aurantia TaxID=2585199 RepID=A0A7K0DNM5_9NOCA|nr:hypothetical protein [Nocardia aurantia]